MQLASSVQLTPLGSLAWQCSWAESLINLRLFIVTHNSIGQQQQHRGLQASKRKSKRLLLASACLHSVTLFYCQPASRPANKLISQLNEWKIFISLLLGAGGFERTHRNAALQ